VLLSGSRRKGGLGKAELGPGLGRKSGVRRRPARTGHADRERCGRGCRFDPNAIPDCAPDHEASTRNQRWVIRRPSKNRCSAQCEGLGCWVTTHVSRKAGT